jgi:hypothetical protein
MKINPYLLAKHAPLVYLVFMDKKIEQFIQDHGLVRIQASPMSEAFDLWEDVGGHVWTWDQIVESVNSLK